MHTWFVCALIVNFNLEQEFDSDYDSDEEEERVGIVGELAFMLDTSSRLAVAAEVGIVKSEVLIDRGSMEVAGRVCADGAT